jgi:hypothetical protein
MTAPTLGIRAGSIQALRLYDVAYAIDLARVEQLWSHAGRAGPSRGRLSYTPSKALAFDVPPVELELGTLDIVVGGDRSTAKATARVYDFGAVVLALRIVVVDRSYADFKQQVTKVNQSIGPEGSSPPWPGLLANLKAIIGAALLRPSDSTLQEDYLFAIVRQWDRPLDAEEVLARVDLAPLLTDEERPLSEGARRDLLRHRFSYYADDLVVMTWDRAFVYEPRGDSDVLDVLEVANAQLLEMRYYDELLDDELPKMYGWVKDARQMTYLLAARRFAGLARQLHALVAEVTELTERVDNALQVTEDVYLARVYSAALESMRVNKLSAAVDRKLSIIRDTYATLYNEASAIRSELLEVTIVLLIVFEIVLAFLGP